MCTVTIVPVEGPCLPTADAGPRLRMVCNRDELRTRSIAAPPRLGQAGPHQSAMPIDADGGGTWVAANDAGLAATLLNLNLNLRNRRPQTRPRSRGEIIPNLMACGDAREAAALAEALAPEDYEPFRLVIVSIEAVYLAWSDGESLTVNQMGSPGSGPMLFTSSGLGDHLVEPPRRALFEELFAAPPSSWLNVQTAFHQHQWPDQLPLSVRMSRDDAATVSITRVELGGATTLEYWASPETFDAPAEAARLAVPQSGAAQ